MLRKKVFMLQIRTYNFLSVIFSLNSDSAFLYFIVTH